MYVFLDKSQIILFSKSSPDYFFTFLYMIYAKLCSIKNVFVTCSISAAISPYIKV